MRVTLKPIILLVNSRATCWIWSQISFEINQIKWEDNFDEIYVYMYIYTEWTNCQHFEKSVQSPTHTHFTVHIIGDVNVEIITSLLNCFVDLFEFSLWLQELVFFLFTFLDTFYGLNKKNENRMHFKANLWCSDYSNSKLKCNMKKKQQNYMIFNFSRCIRIIFFSKIWNTDLLFCSMVQYW